MTQLVVGLTGRYDVARAVRLLWRSQPAVGGQTTRSRRTLPEIWHRDALFSKFLFAFYDILKSRVLERRVQECESVMTCRDTTMPLS